MENKLTGLTMDIEAVNKSKLQAIFPECFTEGRLDIDKLLSLCGEYITDEFEKYEFKWKGKSECLRLAQKRSTATLRPCPEESVNFGTTQNLYIEGDNLEVLKLLQKSYFRKVKMIYIDPPYNTGNDFVYEDDFADPLARYKEVTQQTTKSNPETMGRYHTNWLNMMYPRLRLAANLLRDDGAIFISIDDNEVDNLKKLCNEVFGEENFRTMITWQRKYSASNNFKGLATICDYVLVYSKSSDFQNNLLPRSSDAIDRYSNPDNDPRGPWKAVDYLNQATTTERPNLCYDIINPNTGAIIKNGAKAWKYDYSTHRKHVQENRIWWGQNGTNTTPALKLFLSEVRDGMTPHNWWPYGEVGHTQEATKELAELMGCVAFDYPKPLRFLRRILQIASDKDSIILDFFSGSATTAHAVMQMNAEDGGNRRFIMVQLPEVCDEKSEAYKAGYKNICEIGKERIRRAGEKLKETLVRDGGNFRYLAQNLPSAERKDMNIDGHVFNIPVIPARWSKGDESEDNVKMADLLDTGFRVFKLDSSNLKLWDDTPVAEDEIEVLFDRMAGHIDGLKADRSNTDLVYEILLKMGYPLTAELATFEVDGLTVYTVANNEMLICLQSGITVEHIEKLTSVQPQKIVLAESSFADNSALSNAHYLLENRGIELKVV